MTDFLLELRSEEIPARMQAKARDDLARLFAAELAKAGLTATATQTFATPRRLALIARGLPDATAAVSEEVKGPKTSAPPQALDGFLRKTGLTRDQLVERDGVFFAVTEKPGRPTAALLAEAIPAIVRAFPWPKAMRWGEASASTESLRWVRPLHGIVALFGEELVPVEIAGPTGSLVEPDNKIVSGYATLGHRFHHPGPITIGSAGDYVEKLRACHVIVDQDERATLIRDRATQLAADAGLQLVEDEGLVAENAGLTEWPVPLLGRFDPAFLAVPPEVIQLTARVNQKYFVCRDAGGELTNAFICTANIDATDGGAKIVEGNRKVLAARLSDARFFYEQDLKIPLAEQAKKLDRIVFHEKLGTVADKVDRVAKLARWLVEEGIVGAQSSPARGGGAREARDGGVSPIETGTPLHHSPAASGPPPLAGEDLADLAERAARLAKADLVTGMVGEFPELQGLMGGYYAAAQGEDPRVAAAIRDHYKPVGQGDEVPTDPVTVAVSLADKLDTIAAFFAINEKPTGSKDPFALRRAALGIIQLLLLTSTRMSLGTAVTLAAGNVLFRQQRSPMDRIWRVIDEVAALKTRLSWHQLFDPLIEAATRDANVDAAGFMKQATKSSVEIVDFFADRLKVQQREAGVRHDLIDAVFALGGEDDFVRLLARVRALQAFMATEDGANLLTGYRRAANILKKEGFGAPAEAGAQGGADEPRSGLLLSQEHGTPEKSLSYTPEKDEAALIAALDAAEPRAAQAVAAEDFEGAMVALASLRAPIDAFFDTVTVNDPDAARRAARLALLARMRDAVHAVADFSKIETANIESASVVHSSTFMRG